MLETKFELNGVCIKKICLFTEKDKTIVQAVEYRETSMGKHGWVPVHLRIHDKYHDARLEYLGLLQETAYENANNSQETDKENLFIRGSKPYFKHKQHNHQKAMY
jgi:hypothetical protein